VLLALRLADLFRDPSQPDVVYLKTGTLDDTSGLKPQFRWCDSKQVGHSRGGVLTLAANWFARTGHSQSAVATNG
jgi:hypothetical protein